MQLLEKKNPDDIGLIGHTIINYPNPEESLKIVDTLVKNKASLIELQIPFSEPVADGPVFTQANHEAILRGVSLADCYEFMSTVTQKYTIPFVFMTYANIVFKQGFSQFVSKAKKAGAKGAIIPDLPLDLAGDYLQVCQEHEFAAIPIVSPNISADRLSLISQYFDGFIYAVARTGVTGTKTSLDQSIIAYLQQLRNYSSLPIAVGFGISTREDIAFFKGVADYAVVGTKTLQAYQEKGLLGVETLWKSFNM